MNRAGLHHSNHPKSMRARARVTRSERPMITHLNHVPAWLLDEARSLKDRSAVRSLLMSHTSPECWEYLTPFVEDVVFGNEPAATWLRGQVVVPDWSLRDQL